jgi:integrase
LEEGVGWASEKWTAAKAADLRARLQNNKKTGRGPVTLTEMRAEGAKKRQQAERAARKQEKLNISFKQYFDNDFLPDAKTRWKPDTARKANEHVKNWIDPVTGSTPMKDIKLSHVKKIRANLAAKKRSPRQQQYVFRTFSMVWDAARDDGLVTIPSPTKSKSFKLPKVDNERQRYLSIDEEKALLDAVKKRSQPVHDMAVISIDCGLRFKEVASLTWGCVETDTGTLKILDSKGKDRYVPMTARVNELFETIDEGNKNELVFPTKEGKRQLQIPSSFVRALGDAKLNDDVDDPKMRASFHTLRHTYASRMVQAGVDLYRVQKLLGHSTPIMTARYSKLADDDLKQAVEAMERAAEIKKGNGGKVVKLRKRA